MKVHYKNRNLEIALVTSNIFVGMVVIATFALLLGFERPLIEAGLLHQIQFGAFFYFLTEKLLRLGNSISKKEFFRSYWFEIPLLILLALIFVGAGKWFAMHNPGQLKIAALSVYLFLQVIDKLCRTSVNLAATGHNPTRTLILSFLVLIVGGAGMLMLPKSHNCQEMSFVDALFTSTSATCVTGLIVKDTPNDFTRMGHWTILILIQLGGLGIVIFGAVFALLLGQAFSVKESVAMQDLLSAKTVGRIGNMIGFIFLTTIIIEAIGAIILFSMWSNNPAWTDQPGKQVFFSIFHSVSAFCNAGFALFSDSLISYRSDWQIYAAICPLIVLGGLGFSVLHNLWQTFFSRTVIYFKRAFAPRNTIYMETPTRLSLQTKITLTVTVLLIISGTLLFMVLENNRPDDSQILGHDNGPQKAFSALFQSITCRTAGFNTTDTAALSPASKLLSIILMLIGGSPGSTAGGIKTVTVMVIFMAAFSILLKRSEPELFRRSIRSIIVSRALTVALLFMIVYFSVVFAMCITERNNSIAMGDIMFEAASALGTVGLSTGITASLTTGGKIVLIAAMLIGRLGPMTLLASLTFNIKTHRYNYPDEALIVG